MSDPRVFHGHLEEDEGDPLVIDVLGNDDKGMDIKG